jgi:pseudouridine kinase
MAEEYVLGIGAANMDVHGKSRAPIVMRDSNPGHLRTSAGGVTRNVLENLSRLGVRTRLISAVGADLYGEMVLRSSAAAGIDISGVVTVPGAASSCYISVLDQRGDMLVAMSDMGILESVTPELVRSRGEELRGAAAVVCDPCLPVETVAAIIREAGSVPVFLDPVSTSYARKVKKLAGGFFCMKPNRIELGVLADEETETAEGLGRACEALLSRGTRRVAVSLGERGCYYADAEGHRLLRALHPVELMANANGAGDAFMAGLVYGYVKGLDAEAALDFALGAGALAVASELTINPEMSVERVMQLLRENGR